MSDFFFHTKFVNHFKLHTKIKVIELSYIMLVNHLFTQKPILCFQKHTNGIIYSLHEYYL